MGEEGRGEAHLTETEKGSRSGALAWLSFGPSQGGVVLGWGDGEKTVPLGATHIHISQGGRTAGAT